MADTTKTVLGNYELLKVIGDGAEGRVYQAACAVKNVPGVALGEPVAIKRLFKQSGQDKEPQAFRRQVEILSKLNHPNIVRYKDSFVWREQELAEDLHCLVMELLDGEPLKNLLEKNPRGLPWETAHNFLSQILAALQYAGEHGVIHRDLKPSNIHITSSGVPKLVDFGIARQDADAAEATSSTAGAKGTFDYMAPDFAKDGAFRGDEQSDIFSFGIILHYALTGSLPFPSLGAEANRGYFIRWLGQAPPPAPDFRHPIFRVLNQANHCISRCIHPDRAARFKSFSEVSASFNQITRRQLQHGADTYEFAEWLGKGGFGEVFRARRQRDQRSVAIKRLFGGDQSARFIREAKILREASHPNLTEYVDYVEAKVRGDEREYYLILEFLEGMPGAGLRERIKSSSAGLDPVETLQLFTRYLDCLDHLHRNGIIHRDLKPGNLYAPAGQPQRGKIFDLGIAYDDEGTKTRGQIPGTLDYMPPEFASQSSGRGSPQSDLYSLGVTLYQSLTRQLPFPRLPKAETEAWVEFFRRSEKPLTCSFTHPVFQARPELVPLLQHCLADDPAARFQNAAAMRDEINGLLMHWELASVGSHPDQATEVTLFAKPTAATMVHAEEIPAAEERESVPPAPEPGLVAFVDADPVEQENQRLAAEEAARKIQEAKQEHAQKLTEQAEQRAAETATRRKLMEAKWKEDEAKRQAEEFAAQEEQHQAEAETAEKKRLARERRSRDIADIKAQLRQQFAQSRTACAQFFQAAKIRAQKILARMAQAWQLFGGFKGFADRFRLLATRAVYPARKVGQFISQKWRAWRSSGLAKRQAEKFLHSKSRAIAAWLALRRAAKNSVVRAVQKWRGLRKNARIAIAISGAVLLALVGFLAVSQTRSHWRAKAYEQAVARANAAFNHADFGAAASESEKALAIRGDDPALQRLARDSRQKYKFQSSLDAAIQNGQTALGRQDYTNALSWADAALEKSAGNSIAATLKATARQRLDDFIATASAARIAFTNADFAAAETNATLALALSAKDAPMFQIKAEAHSRLLTLAAYRAAMTKAQAAFEALDFTNAVMLAYEAGQKIPGDAEAARLQSRAQKSLDDYHQAVNNANLAFTNANYPAAQDNADTALSFYRNDAAMQRLKAEAKARFSSQQAYVDAIKNAQAALDRRDYTNALLFANNALSKAPSERLAIRVREEAKKVLDAFHDSSANAVAAFKNGNYLSAETNANLALTFYPNDLAMQKLKARALDQSGNLKAYADEVANARLALDNHEFAQALAAANSALKKNSNAPAAVEIKTEASQKLNLLNGLAEQARSAYTFEDYSSAVSLTDKILALQSQNPAALKLRSSTLRQLDGKLANLLATFGITIPDELKYAEMKSVTKLGSIGETGKLYYQSQVKMIEKTYQAGNWLDENQRQPLINMLLDSINRWE